MLRTLLHPRPAGTLFGIPVRVAPAVFLMAAFTVLWGGKREQILAILLLLLLLALALLVHELAHALVAKKLGIRVLDITIWPLGGMARMEGLIRNPRSEAIVAAAGPFANLLLGTVFSLFPGSLAADAAWLNLVLGFGNLVPAFPLDGGRILRAWLARHVSLIDATRAATQIAKVLALLALLCCLVFGAFFIGLLLAAYLWWSGQTEYRQVLHSEKRAPSLSTAEIWRRACYPWFSSGANGPPSSSPPPPYKDHESP